MCRWLVRRRPAHALRLASKQWHAERTAHGVCLLLRRAEIFAPRQVVERLEIEELQEAVGGAVVRGAPFGVRPLDPQQAAANQVGQHVVAGPAAQTADFLPGQRLSRRLPP